MPLAASAINLADWWFGLSDVEYRSFSKDHLGGGAFRWSDGARGWFDVERFLVGFIFNHWREEEGRADYVRFRSSRSRLWLLRLMPINVETCAEFKLHPTGPSSCELECTVAVEPLNIGMRLLARVLPIHITQRRHMREQVPAFVDDIVAKFRPSSAAPTATPG